MFSDPEIAAYINKNFEPAWQSVRAVPTIQIDFGNGNVIKRTLHGNIATYACASDGKILDVLPGLYKPAAYLDALQQFRLLARYATINGKIETSRLLKYHALMAKSLSDDHSRWQKLVLVETIKSADERTIVFECVARKSDKKDASKEVEPENCKVKSAEAVANWQTLSAETLENETHKRLQIQQRLMQANTVDPSEITSWLYRDVLHADINDPLMGLGPVLTATYPFKDGQ